MERFSKRPKQTDGIIIQKTDKEINKSSVSGEH